MNRKLRDVLVLVAASSISLWAIPSVGQVLKSSTSGTVFDPLGAVVSLAQGKPASSKDSAALSVISVRLSGNTASSLHNWAGRAMA